MIWWCFWNTISLKHTHISPSTINQEWFMGWTAFVPCFATYYSHSQGTVSPYHSQPNTNMLLINISTGYRIWFRNYMWNRYKQGNPTTSGASSFSLWTCIFFGRTPFPDTQISYGWLILVIYYTHISYIYYIIRVRILYIYHISHNASYPLYDWFDKIIVRVNIHTLWYRDATFGDSAGSLELPKRERAERLSTRQPVPSNVWRRVIHWPKWECIIHDNGLKTVKLQTQITTRHLQHIVIFLRVWR